MLAEERLAYWIQRLERSKKDLEELPWTASRGHAIDDLRDEILDLRMQLKDLEERTRL